MTTRTTTPRNATTLDAETVAALAERLRGPLLTPSDDGYDDARQVWNGLIDRRPALIARCSGTADVVEAVNFARENLLLVSVKGGGHNVAGQAVCDEGLVIDLSPMSGVHVDPEARTVRAQGAPRGRTWTGRPSSSGWRCPAAWSPPRGSADSRWAAASAGCGGSTA